MTVNGHDFWGAWVPIDDIYCYIWIFSSIIRQRHVLDLYYHTQLIFLHIFCEDFPWKQSNIFTVPAPTFSAYWDREPKSVQIQLMKTRTDRKLIEISVNILVKFKIPIHLVVVHVEGKNLLTSAYFLIFNLWMFVIYCYEYILYNDCSYSWMHYVWVNKQVNWMNMSDNLNENRPHLNVGTSLRESGIWTCVFHMPLLRTKSDTGMPYCDNYIYIIPSFARYVLSIMS